MAELLIISTISYIATFFTSLAATTISMEDYNYDYYPKNQH
jgi:hypothetical protein